MTTTSSDNTEHVTNDPKPPDPNCIADVRDKYVKELDDYTVKWCNEYSGMKALTADVLWGDFTIDFSQIGIHNMSNTSLKLLRDLLLQHGIFVRTKRGLPRRTALQECWKADECPKNTTVSHDLTSI